jgi:hypothetical protein
MVTVTKHVPNLLASRFAPTKEQAEAVPVIAEYDKVPAVLPPVTASARVVP